MLHLVDVGNDFFLREFFRSLSDQDVLFVEVFRGENLFRPA